MLRNAAGRGSSGVGGRSAASAGPAFVILALAHRTGTQRPFASRTHPDLRRWEARRRSGCGRARAWACAQSAGANARSGTPTPGSVPRRWRIGGPTCRNRGEYARGMRAATIRDGRIEVAERPDPEPQDGQLLVRVRAAGLNGADILQVAGRLPGAAGRARPTSRASSWPARSSPCGRRAARFEPGDRVMAIVAGGGQAELAVVHERTAMPSRRSSTGPRPAACPRSSPPPTTRSSPRPA